MDVKTSHFTATANLSERAANREDFRPRPRIRAGAYTALRRLSLGPFGRGLIPRTPSRPRRRSGSSPFAWHLLVGRGEEGERRGKVPGGSFHPNRRLPGALSSPRSPRCWDRAVASRTGLSRVAVAWAVQ